MDCGDLKKARADIANDTKLIFSPAEEPGNDLTGSEQVAFSAGVSEFYNSHTRETYPAFEASLEFPPGA